MFSGRPSNLPGVDSIAGPFSNTLPARFQVLPEQRNHRFKRAVQADANGRLWANAESEQVMRQSVCTLIQLQVGKTLAAKSNSGGMGR